MPTIIFDDAHVRIPEWEALRRVAGFGEIYLHLDQTAAGNVLHAA